MFKVIRAFSLIELMVVIAIIALLAGVAVPSYQEYIAKARMSTIISLLGGYILQVKDYYNRNGVYPDLEELGYTEDAGYIAGSGDLVEGLNAIWIGSNGTGCGASIGEIEVILDTGPFNFQEFDAPTRVFYVEIGQVGSNMVTACINDTTELPTEEEEMIEYLNACYNDLYPAWDSLETAVCQ